MEFDDLIDSACRIAQQSVPLVTRIIRDANFTEQDYDSGTSGLCATFALAMKEVIPDVQLGLIVLNGPNNLPSIAHDGRYYWRHAVCLHGRKYYDITGEVKLSDCIENYCWNNVGGKGGQFVPISEYVLMVYAKHENGYDEKKFQFWKEKLIESKAYQDVNSMDFIKNAISNYLLSRSPEDIIGE